MAFSGWHPWIESALVLDLPHMQKRGAVAQNSESFGTWSWSCNGEQLYSVQYHSQVYEYWGALFLTDATGRYKIDISSTPLNFGGRRWWLHCPLTGKRALKLRRYGSIGKFCHRSAIRPLPTYASQRVSGLDRIMARRWALRRKLDDPGDLFTLLSKPKWMRWRTFARFERLDEMLASQEDTAIMVRFGCLGIFS
ncbi:MAG: hypothetical protein ACREHG_07595 [Candidatus Saccharimonadales bacterium]